MPPKPLRRNAFELFQAHFDQLLNPAHELPQLARKPALSFEGIDWGRFRGGLRGRLLAGHGSAGEGHVGDGRSAVPQIHLQGVG